MTMNLNRLTEWDRGLPRPDELTPLSQALIPQELACAFNIPHSSSASTCTVATPSSSDVQNTSQSAFESLLRMRSILLPSLESDQKGEAETARPSYQRTDGEERVLVGSTKPFKEASDQTLECAQVSQAGGGVGGGGFLMAGALSSSSPGHDYGSVLGHGISNGLSRLMSSSYTHIPESSGADASLPRASLEDGRGGCGNGAGTSILEPANLMQLKVDPSEEVDSGPSMDPLQGTAVGLSNEEQSARTLKKPRLVWTPQLHKRFVDAVAHLGIKNAVPKTIMQLMNVDGLTRENVASHLQKYRLYLKRMQGLSNEGPSSSDHLFASTPVPPSLAGQAHFLVSHHSHQQHPDHAFGPMHVATLPSLLGHNAHHLPTHITSPTPSFSRFDARAAFSPLARALPPPPSISSEHRRETYGPPHSSSPSGGILTLFPTGGS
eukprot:c23996_g1_i1 orf=334-1641(-)